MYILYGSKITEKGSAYQIPVTTDGTTSYQLQVPDWKELASKCNDNQVLIVYNELGTDAVQYADVYNYSPNVQYDKILYGGSYIKAETRASFSVNTEFNEDLLYCERATMINNEGEEKEIRITDMTISYSKGKPNKMTLTCEIINGR